MSVQKIKYLMFIINADEILIIFLVGNPDIVYLLPNFADLGQRRRFRSTFRSCNNYFALPVSYRIMLSIKQFALHKIAYRHKMLARFQWSLVVNYLISDFIDICLCQHFRIEFPLTLDYPVKLLNICSTRKNLLFYAIIIERTLICDYFAIL